MMAHCTKNFMIFILYTSVFVDAYILPTIFWDPQSPVLRADHWSKVVGVKIFQTLTFLCPNTEISNIPLGSTSRRIYYNLYVRELYPNDTNLDYDTICDPKRSHYVHNCNETYNWKINYRKLSINVIQAHQDDPIFKVGMDYIFFSTSNGLQNSLLTGSTKCTMVFRIHFCEDEEHCPVPLCSTFGREEACVRKSKSSNAPWDVRVTNATSSSVAVSWQPPLNTDSAVAHYSICYRTNTSQSCKTKIADGYSNFTILESLNASTAYFIRLRAVTCKGPGNYSEEILHKTRELVLTGAPENVTFSNITVSSVTVRWETPDVTVGDVIYYRLCVREKQNRSLGRDCRSMIVEPTQLSAVISDLKDNTSYGIRVRAENFKRPGNYCEELIIRTLAIEIPVATTELPPSSSTLPTTSEKGQPTVNAQRGCSGSEIDSMSIIVGIVIGTISTFGITALVWLLRSKRGKGLVGTPRVRNATNNGYRSSVSDVNKLEKKYGKDSTVELNSVATK